MKKKKIIPPPQSATAFKPSMVPPSPCQLRPLNHSPTPAPASFSSLLPQQNPQCPFKLNEDIMCNPVLLGVGLALSGSNVSSSPLGAKISLPVISFILYFEKAF